MSPDEDVTIVTSEQIQEGVQAALQKLGLSFDELHEQAREGSFVSERARLTWFAMGDLAPTS